MSLQKSHEAVSNARHDLDITVVAENIRTPENLGMILRVSEAFGVSSIYFVGSLGVSFTTRAKRASRNTYTLNNFEFKADGQALLKHFKELNAKIIAIEITHTSKSIHKVTFDYNRPIVVVIGSEREGISADLLSMADEAAHIDMFGKNSSLNVTNALSIALHQLVLNKA